MEAEERNSSADAMSSSSDDSSEPETELMVTSRARRATAGNRYSTLVAQEEVEEDADDEVAMLFAEGEGEDDDFNSDDGDDEADMSSSDDDDQGPNAATEDLEGEKEIQKEAKMERARKRKADLALTTTSGLKKKPKFDPTALRRAPAPKPSKRKERVSWLAESNAAPGRTSLRKQTILHRAETHAKMKENEEQRLKMRAKREKREREREAAAPKELTQADRLAEAERVERRNAKSLNRWEATEKKRAEEQAAKLAALKERKLEGAVITWYSSSAKYYGLKETKEVEYETPHEPKKRGRKPKALLEQLAAAKLASSQAAMSTNPQHLQSAMSELNQIAVNSASPTTQVSDQHLQLRQGNEEHYKKLQPTDATDTHSPVTGDAVHAQSSSDPAKSDVSFLTGIHEYASMQSDTKAKEDAEGLSTITSTVDKDGPVHDTPQLIVMEIGASDDEMSDDHQSSKVAAVKVDHERAPAEEPLREPHEDDKVAGSQPVERKAPPVQSPLKPADANTPISQNIKMLEMRDKAPAQDTTQKQEQVQTTGASLPTSTEETTTSPNPTPPPSNPDQTSPAPPPGPPPIEVTSTRNLIILSDFDTLPETSRPDFTLFYNTRKTAKPAKHNPELCPVTGLPARYRDPATGMGYANVTAYKKLQELKEHRFVWSGMLGCYVGRRGVVARGVPEGFLG